MYPLIMWRAFVLLPLLTVNEYSICKCLCALFCVQIIVHVSFLVTLKCRLGTSLVAQMVRRLLTTWETRVGSLGQEDPLEKEMATHSNTLAWKIPWMEERGRLQSTGSQRIRHDWATSLSKCRLYDSRVSEYFSLIINSITLVHTACSTLHFYQYFRRALASAHNFLHFEFFVWLAFVFSFGYHYMCNRISLWFDLYFYND